MKKKFGLLILVLIVYFSMVFFKKYYFKIPKIDLVDKDIQCSMKYKGLNEGVDFAVDEKETYYIAYKNKIQSIDKSGKSYIIFSDNTKTITSLEYYKNKLFFASNNSVYSYDLHMKECKEILGGIPNFGDYKDTIIRANNKYLYITVGAATNSGVVGQDNVWLKNNPYNHDISPYKIILKGLNFEDGKTGAFSNYGTKNIAGQIIPGHFPGNASIIMCNMETSDSATYAWGVRNVKGMDFDSKERIIASVGGFEDRGLRPIKGDNDYIYVIKNKNWYGWPDYSGGDPVNSPKFKGKSNQTVPFLLDNHPTTNPLGPLYVHKNLNSIKSIAVDRNGVLGRVDSIYFYDDKDKKIKYINEKCIPKEIIYFDKNSNISSIKYIKDEMIVLDSYNGNIYCISKNKGEYSLKDNNLIIYFLMGSIFIIIIFLLKAIIKKK